MHNNFPDIDNKLEAHKLLWSFGHRKINDDQLEVYKLLWSALTGELRRFWSRFSVLYSIQVAVLGGVIVNLLKAGSQETNILMLAVQVAMVCYSSFVVAIVGRAVDVYRSAISQIKKRERRGRFSLVTDAEKEGADISQATSMRLAKHLAIFTTVIWALSVLATVWLIFNPIS